MIVANIKKLISDRIEHSGFSHIHHSCLDQTLVRGRQVEIKSYWNNLVKDEYLADGGGYRYRRCGMFKLENDSLQEIKVKGWYYQSPELNKVNGGTMRKFGPLERGFAQEPFLHNLIRCYFSVLPLTIKQRLKPWRVFVHPFRIIAKPGIPGQAAPEGPHRDGHQYTAQIFIDKFNASGAVSSVHNDDMEPLFETTLSGFLETLILDDQKVLHDVTDCCPKMMKTDTEIFLRLILTNLIVKQLQ